MNIHIYVIFCQEGISFPNNNGFNIGELINSHMLTLCLEKISVKNDFIVLNNKIEKQNYEHITDFSKFEWDNNKIYLGFSEEYFIPTIILGRLVFDTYLKQISEQFENDKFILSLSIDYGEYKNVVIRFYKFRDNEKSIILNDLEEYKLNGLLVSYINFRKGPK